MDVGTAVRLRIQNLCEERKITAYYLATISGIPPSTIRNIVNKRNCSTTITTIKKICDGLEITLIEFFDDDLFKNLEQEIK